MIRGNTVGVSMPRSDYGQTDANRADFILNKPDERIQKAQDTADAALPKSGGTMTGPIDMGTQTIINLPAPTDDTNPTTKKYVDDRLAAKAKFFSVTVPADWNGAAAPYTKSVSVAGLMETDKPDVDLIPSDVFTEAEAQLEAWGYVYRGVTSENILTLYATDKPEVALPIQLKVVR